MDVKSYIRQEVYCLCLFPYSQQDNSFTKHPKLSLKINSNHIIAVFKFCVRICWNSKRNFRTLQSPSLPIALLSLLSLRWFRLKFQRMWILKCGFYRSSILILQIVNIVGLSAPIMFHIFFSVFEIWIVDLNSSTWYSY